MNDLTGICQEAYDNGLVAIVNDSKVAVERYEDNIKIEVLCSGVVFDTESCRDIRVVDGVVSFTDINGESYDLELVQPCATFLTEHYRAIAEARSLLQ